jgi:hypothetical protein
LRSVGQSSIFFGFYRSYGTLLDRATRVAAMVHPKNYLMDVITRVFHGDDARSEEKATVCSECCPAC